MSTVITVKTYMKTNNCSSCVLTEVEHFTTNSLKVALDSFHQELSSDSLLVFMSELNKRGFAYLRSEDLLVRISYTGKFPEKDW